jgi:hypothetical protein
MRRSSQAQWASADDGSGKFVCAHARSLTRLVTMTGSQLGAAHWAARRQSISMAIEIISVDAAGGAQPINTLLVKRHKRPCRPLRCDRAYDVGKSNDGAWICCSDNRLLWIASDAISRRSVPFCVM